MGYSPPATRLDDGLIETVGPAEEGVGLLAGGHQPPLAQIVEDGERALVRRRVIVYDHAVHVSRQLHFRVAEDVAPRT